LPPAVKALGAMRKFSPKVPTMGARFIGEDQAAAMNSTMAPTTVLPEQIF